MSRMKVDLPMDPVSSNIYVNSTDHCLLGVCISVRMRSTRKNTTFFHFFAFLDKLIMGHQSLRALIAKDILKSEKVSGDTDHGQSDECGQRPQDRDAG